MKKFLKITLSLLTLAVIGYFVYVQYQKSASLKYRIHEDAESVLKVGVFDLKKTLVFDALSSPGFYWDHIDFSGKSRPKDTIEAPKTGISLTPYALVFYTMKNAKNTLFTTLPIHDAEAFNAYAAAYLAQKKITQINKKYSYAIDEKAKLIYAWNDRSLAIAYNPKNSFERCKPIFDDVLLNHKLVSETEHHYLKRLKKAEDHITILNDTSELRINFEEGRLVLSGEIYTDSIAKFNSQSNYYGTSDSSLQLYLDANFSNLENSNTAIALLEDLSFFNKNNIDVNTLIEKTTGVLSLAIKGATIQSDSIVTYEYDDNFEKVETVAIQMKKVPLIYLNIASDTTLKSYFKEQGALENGVLKALPIYSFYEKDTTSVLSFATKKDALNNTLKTGSYFFSLSADFKSLQADLKVPKADKVAEVLKSLRINAQQLEGNKIVVDGVVTANNTSVNILSQVYFAFQELDSIP